MSASRARLAAALSLATWALAGCSAPPAAEAPPSFELPRLETLVDSNPEVRRQIAAATERAERLLESPAVGEEEKARALGSLAMTYQAYRDFEAAEICLGEARRRDPREFRWAYLDGVVEKTLGRFEAADEAFASALELRPGDLMTLARRGDLALETNRLEAAKAHYAEAAELAPDLPQVLYGRARLALLAEDPGTALELLERAHVQQPRASPILYSLGVAHAAIGNREKARLFFERVPRDARLHVPISLEDPILADVAALARGVMAREHRGLKAAAQGRFAVAAAELAEVVARDPEHLDARHNLGLALLRLNRLAEAEEHLAELLRRDPAHAPTLVLLGNLRRGQGHEGEAEALLRRALEADPQLAAAHRALADLLESGGRLEEARASRARARALDPGAGPEKVAPAPEGTVQR
ncbi:MAG: tetratricopeptide repeat protein [Acidobacteriota bacterium]